VGQDGGDARPNPKPSHNLDLSTIRVSSDQRRFGSGFKNPESQSVPGPNTPDVSAPYAGEGVPVRLHLLQEFPDQEVYSSGTSHCVGLSLTEEEMRENEEANKEAKVIE
jgi:hypothetical protein